MATTTTTPGLGRVLRGPRGIAVRIAPRSAIVGVVLLVVLVALVLIAVGTGDVAIAPDRVAEALFGGADPGTRFIVRTVRLPRVVCAVLAGGALGASGAMFQSLTQNPLGSPDIVGFIQGASAGAVAEIVVFGGGTSVTATGAVAGGLITATLVYGLALRGGRTRGYRLVLVGIGLAAMLTAITDYLLSRTSLEQAAAAQLWLTGSLNDAGWAQARPAAAALCVLLPAAALLARPLRALEMGDDAAAALGVGVERTRLALVAVAVGLCAVATATTGPVAFVALTAPQIARRLTRAAGPGLGCAALMGACLMVAADLLGARAFGATQLPVGVVTGVLGGGYLVWLLVFEWRRSGA